MQLWDEEEQEIRKAYYDRNNIGWTARPKHNHNGFIRKGRFKKVQTFSASGEDTSPLTFRPLT